MTRVLLQRRCLGRFSVTFLCVGNASSYVPSFLISSVLFVRLACGRLKAYIELYYWCVSLCSLPESGINIQTTKAILGKDGAKTAM